MTAKRVSATTTTVRSSPSAKTSRESPESFTARISFGRFSSNAFSSTGTFGALAFFIVIT
jgi:uncharacterized membrane protein